MEPAPLPWLNTMCSGQSECWDAFIGMQKLDMLSDLEPRPGGVSIGLAASHPKYSPTGAIAVSDRPAGGVGKSEQVRSRASERPGRESSRSLGSASAST